MLARIIIAGTVGRFRHEHGRVAARHPLPLDGLVQCANACLLFAVLWARETLPQAPVLIVGHLLLALCVLGLGLRDDTHAQPSEPLVLLHHWLPALFVLLMYFELGLLIPRLRDYSDLRYDLALQAVDVWLLGDPVAFVERFASPWLSDTLTACYFAYYPLALLVPAALYARGAKREFQSAAAIIVVAFMLSYVGYFAFPALGPHRVFDARRPVALDGWLYARAAYEWLLGVPHEPPDAFPSGHALIAALVPAVAFRWERRLFYVTVPISVGIVMATVYLRLHYITDVVAALVLAPVCYGMGAAVARRSRTCADCTSSTVDAVGRPSAHALAVSGEAEVQSMRAEKRRTLG